MYLSYYGIALLAFIINSSNLSGYMATGRLNGFSSASKVGINMVGNFVVETILTFVFVFTVLGVTRTEKNRCSRRYCFSLTLTFIHILGVSLTDTSVNPARSLAPALFIGGLA